MHDYPLLRALGLLELRPSKILAAIGAGVGALGSGLALAALSAWLIARAWQMPPVLDLSVAVVSVRALGISRGVCRYLERLASHDAALRGTANARAAIYARLAVGNPGAVTALHRGDLLARTGEDIDVVGGVVVRAVVPMAVAVLVSGAAVILAASIAVPVAAVLAVALVFAGVVAPWVGARATRSAESRATAARAAFAERAVLVLDHAAELRVSGRLAPLLDDARASRAESTAARDRSAHGLGIAAAATPFAIGLCLLTALWVGVTAYAGGTLTPMALAVLVLLPLAAFESIAPLPEAAQHLTRARCAAQRVVQLLDAAQADNRALGTLPVPVRPAIRTSNLKAGWETGPITSPLTFGLPLGSRTAIVGPSGAGKTTLLATLAGLRRPRGGAVLIDGIPIDRYDPRELRERVGFFAEDAHIFATSILENLRVARGDLTESAAAALLDAVGLGDWVDGLPEGIHTELDAGADALSGGQRRRLLLARAIASPATVLLLDEPTEHLEDAAGADLLRRLLDRSANLVARNRTVVVVTHQLPPDHRADAVWHVQSATGADTGPTRTGHWSLATPLS